MHSAVVAYICRPHDVEDVVHDLESQPHVVPVFLGGGGHLRAVTKDEDGNELDKYA